MSESDRRDNGLGAGYRVPPAIPCAIQSHGWLLVCDESAGQVRRHSANLAELLPHLGGLFLGRNLREIIGSEAAHDIRNALSRTVGSRPILLPRFPIIGCEQSVDVTVHVSDGETLVEIEPAAKASGSSAQAPSALDQTRALIDRIAHVTDAESLCAATARLLAAILQYDRVLICKFDSDGAGRVVTESRKRDLSSFLDRRFPADGISEQARALFLAHKIRYIGDVEDSPVAIVPALIDENKPLELSSAHLRSASPIHRQYLRNMGVAACQTISIVVNGGLWGLIVCQHRAPKWLGMELRATAEMFGEFFSLRLQTMLLDKRIATAKAASRTLQQLMVEASAGGEPAALLADHLSSIAQLLPCDGAALWIKGHWQGFGSALDAARGASLARFIATQRLRTADDSLWSTNALSDVFAPALDYCAEAAGVLAVPLSHRPSDFLFFFRKEVIQIIDWAGQPQQAACSANRPRKDFSKDFSVWQETVACKSHPWSEDDLAVAGAARRAIVEIIFRHSEILEDERGKAEMRQRLLNDELNHRVKNILAVINSLLSQPQPAGAGLGAFVQNLQGRIKALAHAHDQVARGDGGGSLQILLAAELSPYASDGAAIFLQGPDVDLDSRAFSVMALIIHEMAANAVKYGALSSPGGRLDVSWSFSTPTGDCHIDWIESGGPKVAPPSRSGFGSKLIERSIPFDLGGECRIDYLESGARAFISLPSRHLAAGSPTPPQALALHPAAVSPEIAPVEIGPGICVMIVEDQMLIAMDLEAAMTASGARIACTCASVAQAMRALDEVAPDAAILDFNLGDESSLPLAKELLRRGVPFIFATGYGDSMMIPAELGQPIIVRKPYDIGQLRGALAASIRKASKSSAAAC